MPPLLNNLGAHNIFTAEQLDTIVREHLPTDVQPGEKVVVGAIDKDGVQVIASFRFQSNLFGWELQAAAQHNWDGENKLGAKAILRWK